ncbi:CDP-glucose 4,6-dehydratase [Paenibacillus whitsoniae]|uniref:CDP-glucose 4,6-dehydratase n=2 Tax=Paenibacillus whitsoniae TaxID=2496558 RepID=A0A430JAK5_9BACL|nr:CDP-glucose 4,6-dehydratase [Paenibacillus whitsoniae]
MRQQFWQGKRVLITGNTGFKGSWLSLWLTHLGAEVFGFALEPKNPSLFKLLRLDQSMAYTFGDVRDTDRVVKAVSELKPEIIFHLAAQSLVRPSYTDPVTTFSTNIMGTVSIMEAARLQDHVRVLINVTSDKCYENKEWIWPYRETDPMGGHDPYSSSKGCSELVTSAYHKSFFDKGNRDIAIASARAGNVIGGGDWAADRLIPDILNALSENRNIVLRNPNAIRPWQHVLEALGGYLLLAEKVWENKDLSGAWNFGPSPSAETAVVNVASKLVQFWGQSRSKVIYDTLENPHEAMTLKLDSTKAHFLLNWKPRLTLDESLKWIVDWHRQYLQQENMHHVTLEQIVKYEKCSSSELRSRS